jgi:hypothetical protein
MGRQPRPFFATTKTDLTFEVEYSLLLLEEFKFEFEIFKEGGEKRSGRGCGCES